VSEFTPYQAYPNPVPDPTTGPPPVLVAVAGPAQQNRATVAIRLLLIVPHLFVLYFVSIAAGVIAFIGWWAALFTGRLPEFAANFLTGCLRWFTRVHAYALLLTDVYPPFSLDDDPDYPVQVAAPAGQQLNPLAVLFRMILAFPAAVVASVVTVGSVTIVAFIAWLMVLINGQLPVPLHQAYSAVLRYYTRYVGYWWMLSAAYPSGLFGDVPGMAGTAGAAGMAGMQGWGGAAPGWPAGPGTGQPGQVQAGYGTAESVYGTPAGYPAAPAGGWGQPAPALADFPLTLSAAARGLVRTFVALGVLSYAAYIIVPIALLAAVGTSTIETSGTAISRMNAAYSTLTTNLASWQGALNACDGNLSCVTKQDVAAAAYFTAFDSKLKSTSVPANAATARARLIADTDAAARDYTQLSKATSVAQYQSTLAGSGLQQTEANFTTDYAALVEALLSF
jgi:hypothetical protein